MIHVTKETGEKELFSPEKLCASIVGAGGSPETAQKVCSIVESEIQPGTTTTAIFRQALRHLVVEHPDLVANYSLRRGIANLGPAGFVFEQYIATLLQSYGYKTQQGFWMQGECLKHEIDIYATKGKFHFLVETKYRNSQSIKTHVDVIMYAYARLLDIEGEHNKKEKGHHHVMWVVTNTKFTSSAIRYAKCKGIKLVGWSYPRGNSLQKMIEKKKLYPITVLPSMTPELLALFAQKNMVLAQDLLPHTVDELVSGFDIKEEQAKSLLQEVQKIIAS
jgi:hypothetical protein